jgi:hypothetical protein
MIYPNARYEIYVCDSQGRIIAPFNVIDFNLFVELNVTRSINEVGACYIRLSGGSNAVSILSYMNRYNILKKDTILVIYRTIGTIRSILLDTVWFVRSIEQFRESTGSFIIKITAYDLNYLLGSRIILATLDAVDTIDYTIPELMTKLVGMNLGSNALKRQMANFTEIPSAKYGNAIKYYSNNGANFKYYNLHTALQSLSEMSLTPIEVNDPIYPTYFDTVAISNNSFVFQTFPICRGSDRRIIAGNSKGIIVSDTMEQMRNVRLNVDWQSEKTSIWSSFTQTTNTGTTETALYEEIDLRRVGSSPFSLRERYTASPNQEVATHAKASLRSPSSYPRYNISATLQDIPSFLFGVDWNYGDFLTINVFGSQVEARINTISIALSSKSEQIDVGFEISESVIF